MALNNLPPFYNMQYTDQNGILTPESYLFNDEMWQDLDVFVRVFNQVVLTTIENDSNIIDGVVLPSKTTAQITAFGNDTNIPLGTIWFDSTTAELKFKSAPNTIKTIQVV